MAVGQAIYIGRERCTQIIGTSYWCRSAIRTTDRDAIKYGFQRLPIIWRSFLLMWFFNTVHGQDAVKTYSDSILNLARNAPTNELKIEGLLQVSIFWSDRDTVQAYRFLNEAKELMDKRPGDYHSGLYHQFLGNILMEYDYEGAKTNYLKADRYLEKIKTRKAYLNRSKIWNNYAVVLQKQDLGEEYLKITIDRSLPLARLAGDSTSVAYQLNNIGRELDNIQDHGKAESYFREAINTLKSVQHASENKLEVFGNIAKNAMYRKQFDEVRVFLDSAHTYAKQIPHSTFIPYLYRTEGIYYQHLGQGEKALASFQKSLGAAHEIGNDYAEQGTYYQMSLAYKEFRDYRKAKESLLKAMDYHPFDNLHNRLMYQRDMARIEFLLGNHRSAYLEMEAFATGLDSIHGREVALKIQELEAKYKSAERENQILRLEDENRKKELTLAQNRWWQLVLGVGLVLASVIAFFSWKIGKNNKNMLLQKELLYKEELSSIRQQERLRQYDAMLRGQEAERSRLAKDLHDGLGGLLAGIKLKLSSILTKSGGSGPSDDKAIGEVVHQLDYSVDELRRIAHNMMPESLRFGGLVPALSDLCRTMQTPSTGIFFQNLGVKDNYPEQLRITVYRIVQELLANVIKHADANKVIVQCSEMDHWLFVTVEDNGKGMDLDRNYQREGLGLANIQNRISLLNGQIETWSQPGEGTTVNIQIPI